MQNHRIDSLPAGCELHGYRILRVQGSGAFGITYLAEHRHLGTHHVIKEYLPECALREHNRNTVSPKSTSDTDFFSWGLKCFYKEARLLHQLSHPHIVKVADLFEANGTAYFIMPYLRGITLHEWMTNHLAPSQPELEAIFVPLLEGLKYIHDKGLLHRDVKPENIYILESGHPILIDFGSARMAIGQKSKALTQVLTPHFAPIEQYASKGTYTPAMDLYGLAACMYQAITGELPEEAPNRLVNDEQPKLAGSWYKGTFAPSFLRAIDKSLSVHAKDRHQSGFELQRGLVGSVHVTQDFHEPLVQYVHLKTEHSSIISHPAQTGGNTTQPSSVPGHHAKRFVDNSNGTVTDTQTGLMWTKDASPFGMLDWNEAKSRCSYFSIPGISGWRLPSKDELVVLYHAMNSGHPFNGVQLSYYWSSTSRVVFFYAWSVSMNNGYGHTVNKTAICNVWPVRARQ